MTFDAFRGYLTSGYRSTSTGRPLGPHAAGDYPSRLRRLETVLQTTLENAPPMVLRSLADGLRQDPRVVMADVPPKVVGDIAVALRAYAQFLDVLVTGATAEVRDVRPSLSPDSVVAELLAQGFVPAPARSEAILEFSRDGLTLYVRLDSDRPLIIHPVFEECYLALAGLTGTPHPPPLTFYHHSGLSKFPRRDNGQGLIHFGIAFGFIRLADIRKFIPGLQGALSLPGMLIPEKTLGDEMEEIETEATVMAKARRGQGRFRADLLNFWQGRCALTDVSSPDLLRASHIKAWTVSNHRERLDACNGLLLAVHLDALFDRALITFRDSGEMLVSRRLPAAEREIFGLTSPAWRKLLLNVGHLQYMHHHQDRFAANEQQS